MSSFSPMRSAESIGEALSVGLACEYVKDSPLFRQSVSAFETSFATFSPYCEGVVAALRSYNAALVNFEKVQSQLRSAIDGKTKQESRCLFTNSLPNLGNLNESLDGLKQMLDVFGESLRTYRFGIEREVLPIVAQLQKESNMEIERTMISDIALKKEKYEKLLLSTLRNKKRLSEVNEDISSNVNSKILSLRSSYELTRFDLVKQLNCLDSQKKIKLTEVCCNFSSLLQQLQASLFRTDEKIASKLEQLPEAQRILERNEKLWSGTRSRLEAEIVGCLPPPGSPLGAFSPGERLIDLPPEGCLFSAQLTTEVLSAGMCSFELL